MVGFRWLVLVSCGVAGVVACGAFSGSEPSSPQPNADGPDGGIDPPEPPSLPDVPRDTPQRKCAVDAPFQPAVAVRFEGPDVTSRSFVVPRLTDDEKTIYFGEQVVPYRILRATRDDANASFTAPEVASELVTPEVSQVPSPVSYAGVIHPWIGSRAESVYYTRILEDKADNLLYADIWAVVKQAHGGWSTPGKVRLEGSFSNAMPFLTDDTLKTMYFTRGPREKANANDTDLYVAKRDLQDASFGVPEVVGPMFAAGAIPEALPMISADGLELFYRRQLPTSKEIWHATRRDANATFGNPSALFAEPAVDLTDSPGWLSPDGCRLYYSEVAEVKNSGVLLVRTR